MGQGHDGLHLDGVAVLQWVVQDPGRIHHLRQTHHKTHLLLRELLYFVGVNFSSFVKSKTDVVALSFCCLAYCLPYGRQMGQSILFCFILRQHVSSLKPSLSHLNG